MPRSEEDSIAEDTRPISAESRAEPVDWKPQDKCYFCVDGKLIKVNDIGELVVEAGPVQPETELNKHVSALVEATGAELIMKTVLSDC